MQRERTEENRQRRAEKEERKTMSQKLTKEVNANVNSVDLIFEPVLTFILCSFTDFQRTEWTAPM